MVKVAIFLCALLVAAAAHAQLLTNMTPASTPLSGGESVYIVQGGVSKQTTVNQIASNGVPTTGGAYTGLVTFGAGLVGTLTGGASLDLPIAGGSMTGPLNTAAVVLPGGTWGNGALANGHAPLFQNATFSGTTAASTASFGAFLQQTDNGSNNPNNGAGFTENLIAGGAGVIGDRIAGTFDLLINATTGNTISQGYTGLTGRCNMAATDSNVGGGGGSSCFGMNAVATISAAITSIGPVGEEIDTGEYPGSTSVDRVGLQIVDLQSVAGTPTTGVQGSMDDVALTINNQYAPSGTAGFKVGFEFGRSGGNFPVATNGTMIGAQGTGGGVFTVANGTDWSLGTATGYWEKFGTVWSVTGAGVASATGYAVGATVGVSCAAGTVNPATEEVTNGLITHC